MEMLDCYNKCVRTGRMMKMYGDDGFDYSSSLLCIIDLNESVESMHHSL
jgi:hypothetical protein